MPARLLKHPFARIDQDHGGFCRARSGDHVPCVLLVARRIGDDEFAAWGGEVAVRYIDGDTLLALGLKPVGDQGKVDRGLAPALRSPFDGSELIFEYGAAVVQQASDQRALAVIDAARGDEAYDTAFDHIIVARRL